MSRNCIAYVQGALYIDERSKKMQVVFRKIKETDLLMIMNWRMMPEVTKYMYTDPELNIESQKRWYAHISRDNTCKYWIIQVDGVDIGVICLVDIDKWNKRCSWGFYIADISFRGKGLAKVLEYNIYDYVFEKLKLNKLWCEVFAFNEKVIESHKKCGSEIEGIFKEHIYKNGEFFDVVRMGIIKDKWDNIKNNIQYERAIIED